MSLTLNLEPVLVFVLQSRHWVHRLSPPQTTSSLHFPMNPALWEAADGLGWRWDRVLTYWVSLFGQIISLYWEHTIYTYAHRPAHKIQLAICNTRSSLHLELVKGERGKMDGGLFHEHLLMKTNSLRNKVRKKILFLSSLASSTIIRVCLACLIYISGNGCNMKHISITYEVFSQYFYTKMWNTEKVKKLAQSTHAHVSPSPPFKGSQFISSLYILLEQRIIDKTTKSLSHLSKLTITH